LSLFQGKGKGKRGFV